MRMLSYRSSYVSYHNEASWGHPWLRINDLTYTAVLAYSHEYYTDCSCFLQMIRALFSQLFLRLNLCLVKMMSNQKFSIKRKIRRHGTDYVIVVHVADKATMTVSTTITISTTVTFSTLYIKASDSQLPGPCFNVLNGNPKMKNIRNISIGEILICLK